MKLEQKIGIYKITSPSGKIYIGQSRDILGRFQAYKNKNCKTQIKLHNSFTCYGVENHVFEIIEECIFEDLCKRERHYQDKYDVLGPLGMNLIKTRTDELPRVISEETREKLRQGTKNNPPSKERIEHLHKCNTGRKQSVEERRIRSKSLIGYVKTAEHCSNMSKSKLGKSNSAEHNAAIRNGIAAAKLRKQQLST